MSTCTCCAVHNRGAHRTGQLTSPLEHLTPPKPAALVRAEAALDRALQRESQAHEKWSAAEVARREVEAALMIRWRNHPGGMKAAPADDIAELERLRKRADDLLRDLKAVGAETVNARARAAHETHKATQLMIASW